MDGIKYPTYGPNPYGCGIFEQPTIRKDCIHYFCEKQMGANINCCAKGLYLGDCPCTPNCANYISLQELHETAEKIAENKRRNTNEH